jgi:hypothetical protein
MATERPEPIEGHCVTVDENGSYMGRTCPRVTCSCGDHWLVPGGLAYDVNDTIEFHYRYALRDRTRVD